MILFCPQGVEMDQREGYPREHSLETGIVTISLCNFSVLCTYQLNRSLGGPSELSCTLDTFTKPFVESTRIAKQFSSPTVIH